MLHAVCYNYILSKGYKTIVSNCMILGDKGYLSIDNQRDLFTYNQIDIEVPMRKNKHGYKVQPYICRKS